MVRIDLDVEGWCERCRRITYHRDQLERAAGSREPSQTPVALSRVRTHEPRDTIQLAASLALREAFLFPSALELGIVATAKQAEQLSSRDPARQNQWGP